MGGVGGGVGGGQGVSGWTGWREGVGREGVDEEKGEVRKGKGV